MCGIFAYKGNSLSKEELLKSFKKIQYRGPDQSEFTQLDDYFFFGFHRLAIMDLTSAGMQPFVFNDRDAVMCNGELYNYEEVKDYFNLYPYKSKSDCEVLVPLIKKIGFEKAIPLIDGEFAIVYYDAKNACLKAARDPMGIRPLFYGYTKYSKEIAFASEAKALDFCDIVKPFPPGHYFDGKDFKAFKTYDMDYKPYLKDMEKALEGIKRFLEEGIESRLHADADLGFLLSGGLDSSLVCAVAQRKLEKPIKTFSIGTEKDAIDNKYAQQVADFIGAEHTIVNFSDQDAIDALRPVIYHLESWDVTTVRASIGMYLVCKYIREKTSIKTLMTGECSDELFGYKYTDFAPSAEAFQEEAKKRVRELYVYDVLRADRCIAGNSLEARVPFSDKAFVDFVMKIDPKLKMNTYNMGKYLLRKAFEKDKYLPEDILYRDKAAFSDAVGHSMVDTLKAYADEVISDSLMSKAPRYFKHSTPKTKEAVLYRKIFEELFPDRQKLIPSLWMPNSEWENCNVDDPSARVLPNYGKSGE